MSLGLRLDWTLLLENSRNSYLEYHQNNKYLFINLYTMVSNPDIESLVSLLKVAEELLFSFPMPQDVVSKYEFIRTKTFNKCHLPNNSSHIKRLQLEAHSKLDKESSTVINTSTLDLKDPDVQSRIQNYSNFIQKLFSTLERCTKIINQANLTCSQILNPDHSTNAFNINQLDLPSLSLSYSESELDPVHDSYKKSLSASEVKLFNTLTQISEIFESNSSYIKKLELETRENSSFLSKNNAELLEKNRILQEKFNKERLEADRKIKELREEVLLSKNLSLNDVRKAQNREIEKIMKERDMFQEESERLRDQLESVSSTLQQEINSLHEEFERSTQELSQSYSQKLKESEKKYLGKIESLEKTLYYKEKELSSELEEQAENNEKIIKKLEKDLNFYKNNSESLQACLDAIKEIAQRIYKRFTEHPVEFQDYAQGVTKQVEYLDRVIEKLSTDNNWLVDRISELNGENESLKKSLKESRLQETLNDLETSASVLKNFEQSRKNLKKKFSESAIPFPDTYSKLVHKYNNLS